VKGHGHLRPEGPDGPVPRQTFTTEAPMQMIPYLNFAGRCAEAFRFYESILGGKLEMMTHGETPMADQVPPEMRDLVMHARLITGNAILMGSDALPGHEVQPRDLHIALQLDDPAEAERIFAALAEGGQVSMPIQKTFWAERFGMLVDRYGIPWMVNCGPVA